MINIFLLCFNESKLLPHTLKHYKKYMPSCKITILDNESTDNSVEIAKKHGCSIKSWNSNDIIDDFKYKNIKDNCWKSVKEGWIIMADMDELLCVTEEELMKELSLGTSILTIKGYEMIGESETDDLTDIDLQDIKKYSINDYESKSLCFLREKITEMNYSLGAHSCSPIGYVNFSSSVYINKHMSFLGLNFYINKTINRYKRSEKMRSGGNAIHYINDENKIKNNYMSLLNSCQLLQ